MARRIVLAAVLALALSGSSVAEVRAGDSTPVESSGPLRSFDLAASGDILVHSSVWKRARAYATGGARFDFRPMFAQVRSLIEPYDLALCHLETPLSRNDTSLSSYPVFNTPHEIADAIRYAGYDGCSTASNHSLDQGSAGIDSTLDWLEKKGLGHAGTARTKAESRGTTFYDVNGVQVAHLSYAYGFNGFVPRHPWEVNRIRSKMIIADAKRARDRGAEFTIVSLHWGWEYVTMPSGYQRRVARQIMRSPAADLILGHHAHTVQPIGFRSQKVVVFGMGNFLSGMFRTADRPGVQDGVVVHLMVQEQAGGDLEVSDVSYTPTWVDAGSWKISPATGASRTRTIKAINRMGANDDGVHPD
ncbi:MAG: CapA family protein [Actinomycetota bacterium]